jgi:RecA-family ATPase
MTRFNLQNLSELDAQLDEFRPTLTIIDSLKSITQGSEVSENSAEFGDAIYALKELLTKHDSAGVLVHHSNKDKEAQGVAQVRGSTAITGAVWGVWMLKTPRRRQGEEQPKDRWLEISPREGERKTLSIELDP